MNPDRTRATLLQHLGESRYKDFLRDFVGVARRKGRLTFWQEEALANAGVPLTFEECLPVFTLCHVHRVPLMRRPVAVRRDVSDIRYSNEFERATALCFPYAQQFVIFSESLGSAETAEVDQCDQCLEEYRKYVAEHPAPTSTPGLVLIVEDVFQIPDCGTVVTGDLGIAWNSAKIGDEIALKMADGQTIRTCIRDLERMRTDRRRSAGLLLGDHVRADQIPRGTQVFKANETAT